MTLRRILVVKLADLGDALLATPAIRALRETFPAARIDALTTPTGEPILSLCPGIDRVIVFPKNLYDKPLGMTRPDRFALVARLAARLGAGRYDGVVLLHHLTTRFGVMKFRALCLATHSPVRAGLDNGLGTFLTHRAVDYGFGARAAWEYALDVASAIGARTEDPRPWVEIPEAADRQASRILAERDVTGSFIVVHPAVGGYSRARAWPAGRFATVARHLQRRTGYPVVLVGTREEIPLAEPVTAVPGIVNLMGSTSVPEVAAILDRAALAIGADSGIVHLAAALGTPTIAIFGPSNHDAWRPFGAAVHTVGAAEIPAATALVVRAAIPCSPCLYTGYSLGRRDGCRLRTCLDWVTPDDVLRVAECLLERERAATTPRATEATR